MSRHVKETNRIATVQGASQSRERPERRLSLRESMTGWKRNAKFDGWRLNARPEGPSLSAQGVARAGQPPGTDSTTTAGPVGAVHRSSAKTQFAMSAPSSRGDDVPMKVNAPFRGDAPRIASPGLTAWADRDGPSGLQNAPLRFALPRGIGILPVVMKAPRRTRGSGLQRVLTGSGAR